MFCRSVDLIVFCLNTPFYIEIFSENGKFIKTELINSKCSNLRFKTSGKYIGIVARQGKITEYKTIFLNSFRCQRVFVSFAFNPIFSRKSFGLIRLRDANYDFPVRNAILNFMNL